MKIVVNILTKNPCYTANRKCIVKGLMLHSVGCSQPSALVFVKNWNSPNHNNSCVHAFIDGNDGTIYQTLPWDHRGWHAGGSANNTHIGVEMCEPACIKYTGGATFTCSDLPTAKAVAKRTYDAAVELFAKLCKDYNLDPKGDGVIISHSEGYKRGVASGHADPEHLWKQLGLPYTMDTFREAVRAKMGTQTGNTPEIDPEKRTWAFLLSAIGNEYGVAGLMGNLYAESGLNPKNLQNKAGMNPKTLQYLMGHSDIGVTMNVYTHLGLEDAEEELRKMEDFRKAQEAIEKKEEKPITQKAFKVV